MATRPQTPNRGAADERAAILMHLKNAQTYDGSVFGIKGQLISKDSLRAWIRSRTIRTGARAGGLGRK